MSQGYLQAINAIEAELAAKYLPGAIRWCDEQFNGAWSNAIDRFDKALSIAIDRKDHQLSKIEGEFYRATILDLLSRYKTAKDIGDTSSFLEAIKR